MSPILTLLSFVIQSAQAEEVDGKRVYRHVCRNCHNIKGMGISPVYPPLVGSERMVDPDVTVPIRIVLHGMSGPTTVGKKTYKTMSMTPQAQLSDPEIAAVLTYIRQSWGNEASPVTPEQVKAVRDQYSPRQKPWTVETLKASTP